MRFYKSSLLITVLALLLMGVALTQTSNPPAEVKMENLLQMALDKNFIPGREIVVSLVEFPPNSKLERHWHPGEEFHYYLEGEVEIAIEGQEPIIGKPGKVGHVPYKKLHTATTGDKGAKVLVFRVHEEGQPVKILESEGLDKK